MSFSTPHSILESAKTSSCSTALTLGVDIGTSGIRAVVVNSEQTIIFQCEKSMPLPSRENGKSEQSPLIWIETFEAILHQIKKSEFMPDISHCILDATSSTVLICDCQGAPLSTALMYDDQRAKMQALQLKNQIPAESAAHGAASTLAKVMWLEQNNHFPANGLIVHQIDFLNFYLTGQLNITDENNALKLGYDPVNHCWPDWIRTYTQLSLPIVILPGSPIGSIRPDLIQKFNFSNNLTVHAGTTDSIAAFLATGADQLGDAVTSLGSTIAIKLLTSQPIFAPEMGIYSHYLRGKWLVGGASNAGGAVLLQQFSLNKLRSLLPKIVIQKNTGLNYYPLPSQGERFPIADPNLSPVLTPRPKNDSIFLKGLLEGLVQIEKLGYEKLAQLGAEPVKKIYTCGGGIQNSVWMKMRVLELSVEIKTASNTDAAFGVTKLVNNHRDQ